MGKKAASKAKAAASRPGSGKAWPPKRNQKSKGKYTAEDFQDLVKQLQPLNLRVVKMEPDGNCLFRAIADQLCGDPEEHNHYRDMCCNHMIENADEFSLFYADEDFETTCDCFGAYVERMRSPGNWGSQLELMAICQTFGVNVIVHQVGSPSYEMEFSPADARCLQLSYHDGEHYNSVRFEWDLCPGKPVSFLSLQQLKKSCPLLCRPFGTKQRRMKDSDVVALLEEVKYSLPPNHGFEEATLRSTLLQSKYDAGAAVELLLNKLAGVTETHSAPVESKEAAATAPEQGPSEATAAASAQEEGTETAPAEPSKGPEKRAKASRAEKRNERKAKAEAKRKPQSSATAAEDGISRETMEQLSKQLLAV